MVALCLNWEVLWDTFPHPQWRLQLLVPFDRNIQRHSVKLKDTGHRTPVVPGGLLSSPCLAGHVLHCVRHPSRPCCFIHVTIKQAQKVNPADLLWFTSDGESHSMICSVVRSYYLKDPESWKTCSWLSESTQSLLEDWGQWAAWASSMGHCRYQNCSCQPDYDLRSGNGEGTWPSKTFLPGPRYWSLGLAHAKQALYYWGTTQSLFYFETGSP